MNKTPWQLTVIVMLMLVGLGLPFWSALRPPTKWEYKTCNIIAKTLDASAYGNDAKLSQKYIPLDELGLAELGENGWELVSTFLETETVHPNFGKEDYVTGLQPNVRPLRLVCILKRPISAHSR